MGIISGLISMLGWGAGDFLAALSSRKFGNFRTYFWMQIVGFSVASIFFLTNMSNFDFESLKSLWILLFCVAIFQVFAYLSFYRGLETGLVSIVSPVGSTFAAVTVMLSVIFYQEKLSNLQILAIILIILCVVLVSIDLKELKSTKKITVMTGVRQGLQASLGWGISLFLLAKASTIVGWFLPVYIFRFIAIILLIGISLFSNSSLKISANFKNLFVLIPIGLLDISAFFSYSLGVVSEYASIVATVSSSFAIITVLLALIFLKEKLKSNQVMAVLGVIVGIVLLSI